MNSKHWLKIAAIGISAGIINGLFGAGGGTVVVPALTCFFGVRQHKAHATAISIIFPFALISSFVYYRYGFTELNTALKITLGGIVGSYIGSKSLSRFSAKHLRRIFGIFMLLAAIRLVFS